MALKNDQRKARAGFWTTGRLALTVISLLLVALIGVSSCNSTDEKNTGGNRAANVSQPNAGNPGTRPAPATLPAVPSTVRTAKLKTISGETVTLGDYSGKVVLVNLWATWCGPCRLETPELIRLHKEYQSKGVEMIGLTTEPEDSSAESVKDFVAAFGVDYRVGWATPEVSVGLMQLGQPPRDAIPQSFIISRDGRVVKHFIGFSQAYTPPQIKQAIEEALSYRS
jgi:thiol-disulfide isomerase/thioredoxin